jgi:hypothetical protein
MLYLWFGGEGVSVKDPELICLLKKAQELYSLE